MLPFKATLAAAVLAASTAVAADQLSPAGHVAVAPDVAINAKGEIAVLWVDRSPEVAKQQQGGGAHDNHLSYTDLYVAISRDGGKSFGAPAKINHDDGVVWGQTVSRPRLVGGADGTWHVGYTANEIHAGLNKPVLTAHYTRSTDGGATFAAPRRLSTLTDGDMSAIIHGGFASAAAFGTIAVTPDNSVHLMWIDTRHMKSETDTGALYTAVSRDGGASFGPDIELQSAGVCPCCQMMAVADAQSNVLLGWRDIKASGARQSTIARIAAQTSANPGVLGTPVDTNGAPWMINACPLKPTVIATRGDTIYTAVYNGGEAQPGVYYSVSTDGGQSYSRAAPVHPEAAVSDAPSIAMNDRYVLLAWHGKTDGPRRVFTRMFDLAGKPVGGITALETGPENAQNPVVAVRADGKFQIAWQQNNKVFTTVLPAAPAEVDISAR